MDFFEICMGATKPIMAPYSLALPSYMESYGDGKPKRPDMVTKSISWPVSDAL